MGGVREIVDGLRLVPRQIVFRRTSDALTYVRNEKQGAEEDVNWKQTVVWNENAKSHALPECAPNNSSLNARGRNIE